MARAAQLAAATPDPRPNPRVGCVLLDGAGQMLGEGAHHGAGQPHAEIEALRAAAAIGRSVRGATAVVTLEPCSHHGRTGPCSEALIQAGVVKVLFAQPDPNPQAIGGADRLRRAGVEVIGAGDRVAAPVAELNRRWTHAMTHQRPHVIWKVAATLDGRIAAADGSSRWITGPEARAETHQLRSDADAVVVGTGTVRVDDPELTARIPGARQPLRVVMGLSEVGDDARIRVAAPAGRFRHLSTRDPEVALSKLFAEDVHSVLLEGGPTLAAAFLAAGVVDQIRWYVAPKLLGVGFAALGDIGVGSIDDTREWSVRHIAQVGSDVRIDLAPGPHPDQHPGSGPDTDQDQKPVRDPVSRSDNRR